MENGVRPIEDVVLAESAVYLPHESVDLLFELVVGAHILAAGNFRKIQGYDLRGKGKRALADRMKKRSEV
jgi:hypothetical protein